MSRSKPKVIVSGILFWYPLAGVTSQFLHYLVGLRRLGYDPWYVEDSGRWIYDPALNDLSPDPRPNLDAVVPVLERHGLGNRWIFRGHYPGGSCHGGTEDDLARLYREADVLLNVTGSQELREEHLRIPRRIYVETDPVASQILVAQGDRATIAALEAHDTHFSYGENFGRPDCRVPLECFDWQPTRPPVLVDEWETPPRMNQGFYNTVATWRNKGKDILWQGETYYWSKDREFLKFVDLPRRSRGRFELATRMDPETERHFRSHGWRLRDPVNLSRDLDSYRSFIRQARGEFTVAKDQNIRLRSGWFSDRTACYLAAGRPAVIQDTGFGSVLPTGRGLFAFRTLEEILSAVDAIESDYEGHCRAARDLAWEYFSAEKVIASFLERAGLPGGRGSTPRKPPDRKVPSAGAARPEADRRRMVRRVERPRAIGNR